MKIGTQLGIFAGVFQQPLAAAEKIDDGKCRVLSLKGGGIHGAWEAGALKAVIEHMPAEEVRYDYVSGVSIGAVNASIFATFAPGEEKEAAAKIESLYETYKTSDLINFYTPRWLALFTHTSMADNWPW